MINILELNKIHNISCLEGMKLIEDNSIDLIVTSPPYYNAREYSQWDTFADYMNDMENIFIETFRILENHKYIVVNVGDIVGQTERQKWTKKKIPLGAYFTVMLEKIGFQFVDDYIWDKGEPQSKRHLGNPSYPFYQYPVNCYEHIIIMAKHVQDKNRLNCPICNSLNVQNNSQTIRGVQSWECKNPECPEKSPSGRGKRFSKRSIMMNNYQIEDNYIEEDFVKQWRRDIIKLNPVIKINSKGDNILGHTAPYPEEIPEMAIKYFSGVDDIVMDIFMGSGTTGVVAKKLKRNYIGFDICQDYCNLAQDRIENAYKH